MLDGDGASMRLVAGADLTAASLLQTRTVDKDLVVAADKGTRAAREAIINAQKQDEANKRLREIKTTLTEIARKPELHFVRVED